jgi:hypothetical protein
VAIAALHAFNDQMPSPDRRGVASLIERLQTEQDDANRDLAPLVEEPKLAELGGNMNDLVTAERGETAP